MSKLQGVRLMLVLGLAVGAMGLAACGDDDDAGDQAESALSEAADVQSSVQEQAASAVSDAQEQGESIMSEAQSAIDEATSQAQSAVDEATSDAAAAGGGDAAAGKEVFTANCAACHTLADAGASGAVGPNLDDLAPDQATVEAMVRTGGGAMPSFEGQLSDDDITNVAAYVSSVAGQ